MSRPSNTFDPSGWWEDGLLLAATAAYILGFVLAVQAALGKLLY